MQTHLPLSTFFSLTPLVFEGGSDFLFLIGEIQPIGVVYKRRLAAMGISQSTSKNGTTERSMELIEKGVRDLSEDIQLKSLNKIRKQAYLCSAQCCDTSRSSEDLNVCLVRCSQPIEAANKFVDGSMKNFQERMLRCLAVCEDRARAVLSSKPSEAEQSRAQAIMLACSNDCAKDALQLLPALHRDIEGNLKDFTQRLNQAASGELIKEGKDGPDAKAL
eukprot:jgi/Botrbrau1/7091/Bobra.0165s0113.1